MWFFATQSPGFYAKVAWAGDILFSQVMLSLFPHCWFVSRPQLSLDYAVDLMVGDIASFSNYAIYWNAHQVPHLLSVGGGLEPTPALTPPKIWSIYSHRFHHSDMGGSIDGIYHLMLFLPPQFSTLPVSSLAIPVQPWIPLHASENHFRSL